MLHDTILPAFADPYRMIGLAGFLIYIANYTCLALRFIDSAHVLYFCISTLSAVMLMVSLLHEFNLSSALLQAFKIVIGGIAIGLRLRAHVRERRQLGYPIPLNRPHGSAPGDPREPTTNIPFIPREPALLRGTFNRPVLAPAIL